MAEMQSPRIAGRKRGRPPLHSAPMKMAVHNLYSSSACSLPVVKIPKKRGRKPGHKLKSRVLMTPLAISPPRPPRSTPEPDVSSIPQDAAAMPSSAAAAQALTASSPSPDGQDAARPASKNPSTWTVEDVVWFVKDADPQALGPHVELFRKHEIDGNALLLLKSDMIMKYLGLKLGPALKLCYHIDKLKQSKF
uniref:Scm polycomb group protein like 4 n=1 Tax=Sarcophilus harrisii TaxID=9305 RepID=A0A7N4PJY0_SARHA